jgi:hypothetical protein
MTFTRPAALVKIDRILALLATPTTAHSLALALPLSKRWVHEYLQYLHANKRVHIADWAREIKQSGRMYPRELWLAGEGADAPRPPPMDLGERKKRAWQRLRADEDRYERRRARRRVMSRIKRRQPEPAAAWILGAAA